MKFKITKVLNLEGFQKALDRCKGKVEIHTDEGDCLNLRSKLSQLISLNEILCGTSQLDNLELYIESAEDAALLMEYIAGEKR